MMVLNSQEGVMNASKYKIKAIWRFDKNQNIEYDLPFLDISC